MSDRHRPRVTASYEVDAVALEDMTGRVIVTPPSIELHISFDLYDHEAALRLLGTAVNDVLQQIEDTRKDTSDG